MAGETCDHLSITKDLLQCFKDSRSCWSLKQLSLEAVAKSLWENIDCKMENYYHEENKYSKRDIKDKMQEIQSLVLDDTKKLIPRSLHPDLDHALTLKLRQIREAKGIFSLSDIRIRRYDICWTSRGLIDLPATSRLLIKRIFDVKPLMHACCYCLEDEVIRLWETDTNSKSFLFFRTYKRWFVDYWESFVAGKNISPEDIETTFLRCIESGYVIAVEYFWSKLDPNGRDRVIGEWSRKIKDFQPLSKKHRRICYFLLSHATETRLSSLMESEPFQVLCWLVFSTNPESKLFMITVIERISGFIREDEKEIFVIELIDSLIDAQVKFYEDLLWVLWKSGSAEWRSTTIGHISDILIYLSDRSRSGRAIVIAMFEGATEEEKLEFLRSVMHAIVDRVCENRQVMMEKFLEEFLPSEDSIRSVKREVAEYAMKNSIKYLVLTNYYEEFFKFCTLSDEEMVELKTKFCCFANIESVYLQLRHDPIDLDKFLKWCLIPEADLHQLRVSF